MRLPLSPAALLAGVAALAACSGAEQAEESAAAFALDEAAVIERSAPVARAFAMALQAELAGAIAEGGPTAGVSVCYDRAPEIAAEQAAASGAQVTRIAARHRNPAAGVPEDVAPYYAALEASPMAGDAPSVQVWQSGAGEAARVNFLSAIPMQEQPCSVCHGTAVDPALQAHVESLYPGDLATGFAPGDLRGAMWISWPAGIFAGD